MKKYKLLAISIFTLYTLIFIISEIGERYFEAINLIICIAITLFTIKLQNSSDYREYILSPNLALSRLFMAGYIAIILIFELYDMNQSEYILYWINSGIFLIFLSYFFFIKYALLPQKLWITK